jgi:xylulokinase
MGVVKPGEAFLSLGTSGVLFVATDRFRPNPNKAAHAFCHCIPNRWHQMAVLLTAASALDWVARLTGKSNPEEVLAAAQARGLHRGSPFFLPYLSGERTPHNDPHSRGVFFGMTSGTTDADLALAVLEGVAFAFADGLEVLLEDGGEIGDISVIGGGARSPYWGQLLAAALNRPLTYRQCGEIGAAFGAARLARMALSGEAPEIVCSSPAVKTIVEPDAEICKLFAGRRKIFTQLYRDLKNTFLEFSK